MKSKANGINANFLENLILERCTSEDFLCQMKMSKQRFARLIKHQAEATQDEMLRAASVLHLSEAEFMRCFFST